MWNEIKFHWYASKRRTCDKKSLDPSNLPSKSIHLFASVEIDGNNGDNDVNKWDKVKEIFLSTLIRRISSVSEEKDDKIYRGKMLNVVMI